MNGRAPSSPPPSPMFQHSTWQRAAMVFVAIVGAYLAIAYVVMPLFWVRYAHRHPAIDETPGITVTGDDHPGDPINVALIGSEADVKRIMTAAKPLIT